MSLENDLVIFLLLSYLNKNTVKAISLTNKKLLHLVNRNIKKQLKLFYNKNNVFGGPPNISALRKLLLTRNLNPKDLKLYSWGSYTKPGGFFAMIAPRDEIVYGKWDNDYFYLKFERIDYDEANYDLMYEEHRIEMKISKSIFSKNLILLPYHKYSHGTDITDWLA